MPGRRVRNYCWGGEEMMSITRQALTEIGTTKGFRRREGGIGGWYGVEVDAPPDLIGWAGAEYKEDIGLVEMVVKYGPGCMVLWRYSWPELLMVDYSLMRCRCRDEVAETADH